MFNESNTVEALIRDLLCGAQPFADRLAEPPAAYAAAGLNRRGLGWHYVPAVQLPREPQDVFVESFVRDALIRLNPSIAARPDRGRLHLAQGPDIIAGRKELLKEMNNTVYAGKYNPVICGQILYRLLQRFGIFGRYYLDGRIFETFGAQMRKPIHKIAGLLPRTGHDNAFAQQRSFLKPLQGGA